MGCVSHRIAEVFGLSVVGISDVHHLGDCGFRHRIMSGKNFLIRTFGLCD